MGFVFLFERLTQFYFLEIKTGIVVTLVRKELNVQMDNSVTGAMILSYPVQHLRSLCSIFIVEILNLVKHTI